MYYLNKAKNTTFLYLATCSYLSLLSICILFTIGCQDETVDSHSTTQEPSVLSSDEETLSDLKALMSDRPDPKTLPDELKSDQVFPKEFDLVDLQSNVKSQGQRGVCSIFSTVALMEHLYIKKGAEIPDFSEHFLQWSVKAELGRFTHTYGSNGSANINALHQFGVVEEKVMPYQSFKWNTGHDERCNKDNDEKPTLCYTNGDPQSTILEAKRWKLPPSRWINQSVQNLKAFMYENQTGIVVGMKFFYQSWNHRKSALPVNNGYKTNGYVLYPNAKDQEDSLKKSAGHSILIVGWDDELSVPIVDEKGEQILDEEGNPKMETGFFLFKNSWGTTAFGTLNPFGAGYGWLSMRYVEEYGSAVSARPPTEDFKEICDDGVDNNFDGSFDCDDKACVEVASCIPTPEVVNLDFNYSDDTAQEVPDEAQVQREINFEADGYLTALQVEAEFDHSFPGDLEIRLRNPQGVEIVLIEKDLEDTQRPLSFKWQPYELLGTWAQGTWTLTIIDHLPQDQGRLLRWSLSGSTRSSLNDIQKNYQSDTILEIPDADPLGVSNTINVDAIGIAQSIAVQVNVKHSYRGDLSVILEHPDGTSLELAHREGRNAEDLTLEVSIAEWVDKLVTGAWTLTVIDHAKNDTGVLQSWGLSILVSE
jgi:subtilisin-like proprotein convertase family protein/C1A family cysteine protease